MLSASGCATSGPASPDTFCIVARPIWFDPSDRMSERTERAIITHNEKGARLCGWR
jgi:hypothetical protein